MKHTILTILLIFSLWGCAGIGDEPSLQKLPLVVEGWIEENESPIVIVTHAIDLTQPTDSFDGVVEKWGRVSVFDGDTRYILTGRLNKDYTPSFVFTSSRLKGKVGHTYRLLIETETDTVEAFASMLPAPFLLPLKAEKVEGTDSLYYIRADVDGVEPDKFYKFFAKSLNTEKRFYGTFLGTFSGADYDENTGIKITKGIHSGYSDETFDHYYHSGDRVNVKLCSLEPEIYDFWHVYDDNVMLSENVFFTFDGNCPSNIVGGLGYWAAYGTSIRSILIPLE